MKFIEFLDLGAKAKALTERANVVKNELSEFVDAHGNVDEEKGHKVLTLPDPVEIAGKRYVGFMRQRRVTTTFNEEKAEELLTKKGIDREDFISTQEYVDQDKVYRLYADDILTEEEMKSLLDEKETYAFVPTKES